MSNYASIGKEMDDIMSEIAKHEADVKTYSDKAMTSLDLRNQAQAKLLEKQQSTFDALAGIQAFIAGLTVLPAEVVNADTVFDAEAAAAEAAANAPTPEPDPIVTVIDTVDEPAPAADTAADPAAADLGLPGADTLDTTPVDSTPDVAPEPVVATPDVNPTPEQPVTFEEPVAGDLGLIGEDPAVGPTDTPVTETADDPAAPPVEEPAPLVDPQPEPTPVDTGAGETEEEPAADDANLDPLTGLPKPAL